MLERINSSLLAGGQVIVGTLRAEGYEALFAGGVVRDLLLGRQVSDIDVATSAPPEAVERLFPNSIPVGRQFGVVVVVIDSIPYEVSTFRLEHGYEDGRHPTSVEFTDARQDALRRDFTVNALFLDPQTEEVLDFVGGQMDLQDRIIRTVGQPEARFREDKLRILRALRLACQLNFQIDPLTWEALRRFAPELPQVSWERIRDELLKTLTGPNPARGLQLLSESGLLEVILPEVAALRGVPQPPEFHPEGDVFEHTNLMLKLGENLSETLALGALLHDVGKPPTFAVRERIRFDGHAEVGAEMAREVCRRLRLSNEQTEAVVDLVKNHLRFIHVREMRESTLKRFLRKANFHEHLELHRLDCLASHGDLSNYHFCRQKLEELSREAMRPPPLIRGHDLIALGFKPGPVFKEILTAVEDLQLEGGLSSKEEALQWVHEHYPRPEP